MSHWPNSVVINIASGLDSWETNEQSAFTTGEEPLEGLPEARPKPSSFDVNMKVIFYGGNMVSCSQDWL